MGSLSSLSLGEMTGPVIKSVLQEAKVEAKDVDEVILGNVLPGGQGQGVARQASLAGGVPKEIPAYAVGMVCGSGLKSVHLAFNAIKAGSSHLVLAGGMESMSGAGFVLPGNIRSGHKMGALQALDHMVYDALTDAYQGYHMGITAENVAEKHSLTREAQDEFAFNSQKKAIEAQDKGCFKEEIVPIEVKMKKETIVFDKDEYINRSTSLEKLSTLKPAFKKDGTVTAGNASGINDGAAVMLLASEEAVSKYGLKPLAEVLSIGHGGVDPSVMGLGVVPAVRHALKNAHLSLKDMELLELNEAFAAQSLGVMAELIAEHKVDKRRLEEKTNVNGGAIALGHPVGASGARILVSLSHEMKRQGLKLGLASLCIGGGMGVAAILKRS